MDRTPDAARYSWETAEMSALRWAAPASSMRRTVAVSTPASWSATAKSVPFASASFSLAFRPASNCDSSSR